MRNHETLGALLLGGLGDALLYGMACTQCFKFFFCRSEERKLLRYSVGALWLLDTLHMCFVISGVYWYTILHFANPLVIEVTTRIYWVFPALFIVAGFTCLIVQSWFAYRLWIISGKNRWAVYPVLLAVAALWGVTIAFGVKAVIFQSLESTNKQSYLVFLWSALPVAVDSYITITLSYYFYQARCGVTRRTESLINKLIIYTVNTGLITSVASCACLISYAIKPYSFIFIALNLPISMLYTNIFVASLNARDKLRSNLVALTLSLHIECNPPYPGAACCGEGQDPAVAPATNSASRELEPAIVFAAATASDSFEDIYD